MGQIGPGAPVPAVGPGVDAGIDRRSVLGFVGLSVGGLVASRSAALTRTGRPIRYVVTDRRHQESLDFGEALAKRGAIRLELTQGLTQLWRDVLMPHWRGRTGAVAGMTAAGAWLALSEQARSEARRSALVGRHAVGWPAGAAAHVITAPEPALAAVSGLDAGPGPWPTVMAGVVACCASAPRRCDVEWRNWPPITPDATRCSLVSWIIA